MTLTAAALIAQMPTNITAAMPYDLDAMADYACAQWVACGHAQRDAAPILMHNPSGWSVTIDGTTDPATKRQGGSRGCWPTLRLALLATILLAHRTDLPITGQV